MCPRWRMGYPPGVYSWRSGGSALTVARDASSVITDDEPSDPRFETAREIERFDAAVACRRRSRTLSSGADATYSEADESVTDTPTSTIDSAFRL
jgi:hypothetical protein